MERSGVPSFALNVAVGLSVPIKGFGADVARGLLGELPFGAVSLVGVRSLEDAQRARTSGADALLVKRELLAAHAATPLRELMDCLRSIAANED